jgi:nucleoid-associated protein YgaU
MRGHRTLHASRFTLHEIRVTAALGVLVAVAAGCRAPTRVAAKITEVPRIDVELSGGNRGYLVGSAPEAAPAKTTRQMVEATIEIPSFYKPRPGASVPPPTEEFAPPETDAGADEAAAVQVAPATFDTYVVQKGESLWSIAARPEIYGKATQWRRLFDANRDLLKAPDQVKPGMTLKVPRGEAGADATTYEDEGITYKK